MDDRRRHPRIHLQLPIGKTQIESRSRQAVTADISSGGMYFIAEEGARAKVGQKIKFELVVPAGEGYWPAAGKIVGRGEVIRTSSLGNHQLGVAMRFLTPLSLDFPPVTT